MEVPGQKGGIKSKSDPVGGKSAPTGTLTCPIHPQKVVEIYCGDHRKAVCALCALKQHKSCGIEEIVDVSQDYDQSKEYGDVENRVVNLKESLISTQKLLTENIKATEQSGDKAIEDIKRSTAETITKLKEMEKAQITEVRKQREKDVEHVKYAQAENTSMKDVLTKVETDLQKYKYNNNDLYVKSKEAKHIMDSVQMDIDRLFKQSKSVNYSFLPGRNIEDFMSSTAKLGTTLREETQQQTQSRPKVTNFKVSGVASVTLTRLGDVNARSREDEETCWISGAAALSAKRLLVADYSSQVVKLVDSTNNAILSTLRFSSAPWGVALLPSDEAAVTVPVEGKVYIISTREHLSHVRNFNAKGACWGIASTKDKLIITSKNPDQVQVVDHYGGVLHKIDSDSTQSVGPFFKRPNSVAVTREDDMDVIYVADRDTRRVTKLSMTGQVIFTYTDKNLRYFQGLAVVNGGELLVCGQIPDQVQLLSPGGNRIKTLLTPDDGLYLPYAICVCPESNKLNVYVCNRSGSIFVYEMRYILQVHYPNISIEADNDGNVTLQSGEDASVYIVPGPGGSVFYEGVDILLLIRVINGLPPAWKEHSSAGFFYTAFGGDVVDVKLEALDNENRTMRYSVVAGTVPPGLVIDSRNSRIYGQVPDVDARFSFTVRATNPDDKYADAVFKMEIIERDQCRLMAPCMHGGTCIDLTGDVPYYCNCTEQYSGRDCDIDCRQRSLGVTNDTIIPKAMMSAYLTRVNYTASEGRLDKAGKGWCGENSNSWLQIDLGSVARLFGAIEQSYDNTYYTGSYYLSYSTDGMTFDYVTSQQVPNNVTSSTTSPPRTTTPGSNNTGLFLFGGSSSSTKQMAYLPDPVQARFVRFHPVSYSSSHYPCMRVDLLGCRDVTMP